MAHPDTTRRSNARQNVTADLLHTLLSRAMTGEELRKFREALNLSREELASVLGVTRMTVWRGEHSKPSRLLQSLLDQALARGQLKLPPDNKPPKKSS